MYITVKNMNKTLGKWVEYNDLYIGIPLFIAFLIIFSFTNYKLFSFIFLSISVFIMLPIKLSKKNRMYKVMFLVFKYIFKNKEFIYFRK